MDIIFRMQMAQSIMFHLSKIHLLEPSGHQVLLRAFALTMELNSCSIVWTLPKITIGLSAMLGSLSSCRLINLDIPRGQFLNHPYFHSGKPSYLWDARLLYVSVLMTELLFESLILYQKTKLEMNC